jgi:EF hand
MTFRSPYACLIALTCLVSAPCLAASVAPDMAKFATGGYAAGMQTKEMMSKVDTDGDGMVSKAEWLAFQEKIFTMLDRTHQGRITADAFMHSGSDQIAAFATGGFARGLQSKEMLTKIDTNSDGFVSHEEYLANQTRIFDLMDTSTVHKGVLGPEEIFACGGPCRK